MMYKQIVFSKPYTAEVLNYTLPDPTDHEVQVRLMVSTVSSGTERANLIGNPNISPHTQGTEVIFPRILGYSASGVVEKTGCKVHSLKAGDRVAMCWSTHSQIINIREDWVIKISDNVSFEDGAMIHIGVFPLAAIRKCGLEFGESALVMGLGILGMTSLPLLKQAGAAPIIAACTCKPQLEKALRIGADYALDATDPHFADTVREITEGGVKTAIELSGVGAALNSALDCIAKFGRLALTGCMRSSDFTVDYYRKVHGPGITLIGAHTDARPQQESRPGWWTCTDDMRAIEKMIALGRFRLANIIDEVHPVLDAPEIYNRLVSEQNFPLVQFDWRTL